jgi:hypothetical protein
MSNEALPSPPVPNRATDRQSVSITYFDPADGLSSRILAGFPILSNETNNQPMFGGCQSCGNHGWDGPGGIYQQAGKIASSSAVGLYVTQKAKRSDRP